MSEKKAPKIVKNRIENSTEQQNKEKEDYKEKPIVKESPDDKKKEEEEELKKKIELTKKAGEIAKKIKDAIRPKIKVGVKAIDIIKEIENMIFDLEAKLAFPINICVNNIAAHYTSPIKDEMVINEGDIVKIDFGVHIDGFCVDNAFTLSFNEDEALKDLVEAPEVAVKAAIMMMKPGVKTNEIGNKIEQIIKGYGFKSIKELGGHSVERWRVHGSKELPNQSSKHGIEIEENEVYAVEVFASTGEGTVHGSGNVHIYSLNPSAGRVPLRRKISRKILGFISKEYKTLPFCERQLIAELKTGISFGLQELKNSGKITQYPVLLERKGVYISQHEETVLITKDGCTQLT